VQRTTDHKGEEITGVYNPVEKGSAREYQYKNAPHEEKDIRGLLEEIKWASSASVCEIQGGGEFQRLTTGTGRNEGGNSKRPDWEGPCSSFTSKLEKGGVE